MTRIYEIHGVRQIPADEYAGRGAEVTASGYVPYLSLTQGEMKLWLAAQRAKILSQWYGSDAPQYAQAATMIENALHQGITGGVSFVGAIHDDYLQRVARIIQSASHANRPAASIGILARRGRGIGQIIPVQDRLQACYAEADKITDALKRQLARAKCRRAADKETIINKNLVGMSPHMLYKSIPKGFRIPTAVETHRTLHRLGVEGIAGVGDITDYALVYEWIENGILQKNTQAGAGPIGSVQASFSLAPNADALIADWDKNWKSKSQTKWIRGARIGLDPVVGGIIIAVLSAAIKVAGDYLTEIRKTEILAMSEARGFGTPEFSANQDQWLGSDTTAAGGGITPMLLFGGAAVLLLMSDNK